MKSVPIVDASIVYDCTYSMKKYILIVRNALYVQSMTNNLIPPFIMREAGLEVREIPKIHVKEPTVEEHSIYFSVESLRIPLSLNGIFSSFPTRRTTTQDLIDGIPVLITPEGPTWNPYSNSYKQNEDSHLDWKGEILDMQYHNKALLNESDNPLNI